MTALDRRTLLCSSGLGLAGLVAACASARRASGAGRRPAPPELRLAVGLGMIEEGATLAEKFQLAADLGFEGIELLAPEKLGTDEVLAAKERSGLAIADVVDSVHWQATLGDPDPDVRARGRAGLEAALRACHAWGGASVLLVPAVVDGTIAYDQAYARSQAEIRRLVPLARELGVPIAIENVWNHFLLSPLEAARYVDELGSDAVGWHMDLGNVVNTGWPEQWIRVLGARIRCLHVKEFSRRKRDAEGLWKGFEVELGEGDCDWPAILRALGDVGYRGWAVAEVEGGGRERLRDVHARMQRLLGV